MPSVKGHLCSQGSNGFCVLKVEGKTGYLVLPSGTISKESDRQVVKTGQCRGGFFLKRETDQQGVVLSAKESYALLCAAWVPAASPWALLSATIPDDGRASSHTRMCNVAFGRFLFLQRRGAPGRQQLPKHVSISPNFMAAETFMTFPCVLERIVLAPGARTELVTPQPRSSVPSPHPLPTDTRHSSQSLS